MTDGPDCRSPGRCASESPPFQHATRTACPVARRLGRGIGQQQAPCSPSSPSGFGALPRRARRDERIQFRAIGGGIAFQEERQHRIGERNRAPLASSTVVGGHVAGAQQALGAVRLDPLVVAVGGAARIGDLAQSPAAPCAASPPRYPHRRRRRSPDPPGRTRRRAPRPVPRPAGSAPCPGRGSSCRGTTRRTSRHRRAAAAPGSRLMMVSSSSEPISPASSRASASAKCGSKRRLNPTISGTPARRTASRQARTRGTDRSIGFSQKIARPGGGGALDVIGMRRRRRADQHRVGARTPRPAIAAPAPHSAAQALRRRRIDIGHAGQARAGMGRDVARMDLADPAGADHRDAQHAAFPSICLPAPSGTIAEPRDTRPAWREDMQWARSG